MRQVAIRFQMARAGRVDLSRGSQFITANSRPGTFALIMAGWLSTKDIRGVLGWCIRGPCSMALLSAEKLLQMVSR